MLSSSTVVGLIALTLVYVLLKRFTRRPLSMIRGPNSSSFIFGNMLEIFQRPVGEADFAWQNLYGNVVRFKGLFGEDRLLVTDPKALQKILHTSPYSYSKLSSLRTVSETIDGPGVVSAEGENHKRQRNAMALGFGVKESRAFLPIFNEIAESLGSKWSEIIGDSNEKSIILNVRLWLSRAALDAIGQAAFNVQFNTIQDNSHPLAKMYENFLVDIYGLPSAAEILAQLTWHYVPALLRQWIFHHSTNPRIARARDFKTMTTDAAKELVREKAEAVLKGRGNRDIFTLLVTANMDPDAKNRLTDEELMSQMRMLLFAGHESTANTVTWTLLELARNPEIQCRLRDEIRKTEATIQARGESRLTVTDLDAMDYLNAVVKEGLRFHPVAPYMWRVPYQDDVLPISKPVLTETGDMINEVLVPKGTPMLISAAAYNRNKDLWGEDANEFNPDRWLNSTANEKKLSNVGVYSNLLTFLSGPRACIGWRIAVLEIQAFVFEFAGKFEFATTDKSERVLRQLTGVMNPMVDGELDRGVQLPLVVSLASRGD